MKQRIFGFLSRFWRVLLGGVCLLAVGLLGGWYLNSAVVGDSHDAFTIVRDPEPSHKLVNPILLIQVPQSYSFPKYAGVNSALSAAAHTALSEGKVQDISIYFRDMQTNNWIAYNQNDTFSPASMLKVVTLVATLHASEAFPQMLAAKVTTPAVLPNKNTQDYYPPQNGLQPNTSYSVQQLLAAVTQQSDNNANDLLLQYVGQGEVQQTFASLQLPIPADPSSDALTAQQYSRLFRVLYNATYLTPDLSEEALDLLSRTTFTEGLVAGVPSGTTVAHKFGERTVLPSGGGSSTQHELHDCGIVYYPGHPYFLCVMTRGTSFPDMADAIASVSHATWQSVSTLYP